MGVERLHHEADGVSVQLVAKELRKTLRCGGGQQFSAGGCVFAAAGCVQSLTKFKGAGGMEVDGEVFSCTAARCVGNIGHIFLIVHL